MRKRLLALLLCLCMAATFLPGTAWAEEITAENAVASVTIGSDTKYYETIEAAWTAATTTDDVTEATVTLLKDAEASSTLELANEKAVTLTSAPKVEAASDGQSDADPEGENYYTLKVNATPAIKVGTSAMDTPPNTAGNLTTKAIHIAAQNNGIWLYANSHLTVEDGTLITSGTDSGQGFYAVNSQVTVTGGAIQTKYLTMSGGSADISGGTFDGRLQIEMGAAVTISGGTFLTRIGMSSQGQDQLNLQENRSMYNKLTVTGGTINGIDPGTKSIVEISGGTIGPGTGDEYTMNIQYPGSNREWATVNITGGQILNKHKSGVIYNDGSHLTISGNASIYAEDCSYAIVNDTNSGFHMGGGTIRAVHSDTNVYELGRGAVKGRLTMNGGKVISEMPGGAGVYVDGGVVINGGTITSTGKMSYGMRFGDNPQNADSLYPYDICKITGGSITATGEESKGIYFDQRSNDDDVTISDGTISATGTNSTGIYMHQNSGSQTAIKLTITGGNVSAEGSNSLGMYVGNNKDKISLSGGSLTGETTAISTKTDATGGSATLQSLLKTQEAAIDTGEAGTSETYAYFRNGKIVSNEELKDTATELIGPTISVAAKEAGKTDVALAFTAEEIETDKIQETDRRTLKLNLSGLPEGTDAQTAVEVSCTIGGEAAGTAAYADGAWTVQLPNETAEYLIFVNYKGDTTYYATSYSGLVEIEHVHVWDEEWKMDSSNHWRECTHNHGENNPTDSWGDHDFKDGVCTVCGYQEGEHIHDWAEAWATDETHHWHECTLSGCPVTDNSKKNGYGEHVYDNGQDTTCNTCSYVREVTTDPTAPAISNISYNYSTGALTWTGKNIPETNPDQYFFVQTFDAEGEVVDGSNRECMETNVHEFGIKVTKSGDTYSCTYKPVTLADGNYKIVIECRVPDGSRASYSFTLPQSTTPDPDPTPDTPSGGGSSSGGSTTTETTKNPDGSTTTKTENKTTGTVTETTKNTDGSTTKVETKKDGTVTTTQTDATGNKTETVAKPDGSSVTKVNQKDGTKATVNTDTEGKVEAEVTLPKQAVAAAQENEQPIMLPVPRVEAAKSAETAPVVTVKTGSDEPVKVLIPTTEAKPGTVAVIVKEDGTEEIVKTSVSTADGLAVSLPDGATVKVVDNSKTFADVPASNWAADAVSFSSARELFSGTSESSFSPEQPMTRAMMVTVLARFDGADTSGGNTWYEQGVDWAVSKGISDGSNPNGNISREQLAVMLWRYAGSPAPTGGLEDFHDAGTVSDYAQEAMCWAVESGIVNGNGSGALLPQGEATRAQVAQMLKNFIEMK